MMTEQTYLLRGKALAVALRRKPEVHLGDANSTRRAKNRYTVMT
jgi:hypothetical protein